MSRIPTSAGQLLIVRLPIGSRVGRMALCRVFENTKPRRQPNRTSKQTYGAADLCVTASGCSVRESDCGGQQLYAGGWCRRRPAVPHPRFQTLAQFPPAHGDSRCSFPQSTPNFPRTGQSQMLVSFQYRVRGRPRADAYCVHGWRVLMFTEPREPFAVIYSEGDRTIPHTTMAPPPPRGAAPAVIRRCTTRLRPPVPTLSSTPPARSHPPPRCSRQALAASLKRRRHLDSSASCAACSTLDDLARHGRRQGSLCVWPVPGNAYASCFPSGLPTGPEPSRSRALRSLPARMHAMEGAAFQCRPARASTVPPPMTGRTEFSMKCLQTSGTSSNQPLSGSRRTFRTVLH